MTPNPKIPVRELKEINRNFEAFKRRRGMPSGSPWRRWSMPKKGELTEGMWK